MTELTRLAALNNAQWCDAVCRSHGRSPEFHDGLWVNSGPTLPYYPNIVTLNPSHDPRSVVAVIDTLMACRLDQWSVKDSFSDLDLAEIGMHILFDATWIATNASDIVRRVDVGIEWRVVVTVTQLHDWSLGWGSDEPSHVFQPLLLEDAEIRIIAGLREGRVVAGAIVNRTPPVVGISNVFTPPSEAARCWSAIVNIAREEFPGLDIVGYEHGESLEFALSCGFRPIGPLRVWVRQQLAPD